MKRREKFPGTVTIRRRLAALGAMSAFLPCFSPQRSRSKLPPMATLTDNAPGRVGMTLDEIETPALLVDLPILEANIARMHDFFLNRAARVRSVTKGHKSQDIAKLQMAADGAVPGGISCSKISEAEVMVAAGATEVRMIEQVVGPSQLTRLASLAERATMIAVADAPEHLDLLDRAAEATGVRLDVMLEVEIGLERCGVRPGADALALARDAARRPNLRFRGLHAHEGAIMITDYEARGAAALPRLQRLVDCRSDLEAAGLEFDICGAGATTTWDIAGRLDGITEIDPGSYALMDARLAEVMPESGFGCALSLIATVISRPARNRAVLDVGHKAVGLAGDGGWPAVVGRPGVTVNRLNSEHGILDLDDGVELGIGERVRLIPRYHGSTIVAHSHYLAVRDGVVEAVWGIAARGAHV